MTDVTKLPRLLSAFNINSKTFKLQDSSLLHLKSFRRTRAGTSFRVFDGRQGEYLATLQNISGGECILDRKLRDMPINVNKKRIWLFTSSLERARHSFLIEKAVEMDAAFLFTQLVTERTQQHGGPKEENIGVKDGMFVKSQEQDLLDKSLQEYYNNSPIQTRPPIHAIYSWARDATQQCERLTIPTIGNSLSLQSLLDFWSSDVVFDSFIGRERLLLICDEDFARDGLKDGLNITKAINDLPDNANIGVLIGPEGGFTKSEKELFKTIEKESRFKRISLGPNILRVETAAIVALSQLSLLINYA
jgi:16S rRNA U1498 N3-methylase RsmE